MRGILILLICICYYHKMLIAQASPHYTNGYLLSKKDTQWCKILFDERYATYKSTLKIEISGKRTEITLNKNDSLIGFGVVDDSINYHYGRIKIPSVSGLTTAYRIKLVQGTIELLKHEYAVYTGKLGSPPSENKQLFADYFIGHAATNSTEFPRKIGKLSIKKLAKYLEGYSIPSAYYKKKITEPEAINLIKGYNQWYLNFKKSD
jgi:hypothetical protein